VDAHIHVGFQKTTDDFRIIRVPPAEVLEAFVRFGWRLEGRQEGRHVPAWCWSNDDRKPARFEYRGTQSGLIEAVRQAQLDRNCIGTRIWWPETWQGGDLYVYQREQTLLLGRPDGGVWRELPGSDYGGFTDYNWYVPRLVKPLELIGAGVYEVRSYYHF
jgi:hypothetical protein